MLKKFDFKKVLCIYKIYFMLYVLLAFNGFVNGYEFMQYATGLAAAAGVGLILWMMIQYKLYWKTKNLLILLLFIASYILSSVMNYRYGIMENIQSTVWMVLQMGLLYVASSNYKIEEVQKEFKLLASIYVAYCTIANVISITMVYWGRALDYKDPMGGIHAIGFRWGRLWGIYDDPNHGATITVAAIFFALYLFSISAKKRYKVPIVLSIIVQFSFIVFSDSRTGLVCLLAGVFIWSFIRLIIHLKKNERTLIYIKAFIAATSLAALVFVAAYEEKQLYNGLDKQVQLYIKKHSKPGVIVNKAPIGRAKDLVEDSSNGRIGIWESGFEMLKESPLYGVSYRNMTEYAEENMPEAYLVKNNHHLKYDSMHSMPIDVLISQGIIGVILLMALIANTIIYLVRNLNNIAARHRILTICVFVVMVVLAIGSVFLTMIFNLNAPQTYCFWLCFGYLMAIFGQSKSGEKNLE